jgi:hypothetical protein
MKLLLKEISLDGSINSRVGKESNNLEEIDVIYNKIPFSNLIVETEILDKISESKI